MFPKKACSSNVGRRAVEYHQLRPNLAMSSSHVNHRQDQNKSTSLSEEKPAKVPLIRWKYPPIFALKPYLLVAAGEESHEVETQKDRERKVPEAIYSCPRCIPLNPSISKDVEECMLDDSDVPIIPLTLVEDEQVLVDPPLHADATLGTLLHQLPQELPQGRLNSECLKTHKWSLPMPSSSRGNEKQPSMGGSGGDAMAAAFAVFTAIKVSQEPGNLIDTDLLIELLKNPAMIEKMMNERGLSVNPRIQNGLEPQKGSSSTSNSGNKMNVRSLDEIRDTLRNMIPGTASTMLSYQPNKSLIDATSKPPLKDIYCEGSPSAKTNAPVKDLDYCRNLVRNHEEKGKAPCDDVAAPAKMGARSPGHGMESHSRPIEVTPMHRRPLCRGCRNGSSSSFPHVVADGRRPNRESEEHRGEKRKA